LCKLTCSDDRYTAHDAPLGLTLQSALLRWPGGLGVCHSMQSHKSCEGSDEPMLVEVACIIISPNVSCSLLCLEVYYALLVALDFAGTKHCVIFSISTSPFCTSVFLGVKVAVLGAPDLGTEFVTHRRSRAARQRGSLLWRQFRDHVDRCLYVCTSIVSQKCSQQLPFSQQSPFVSST
jgi:hypothetical protein